ncbi:hypothetical protein PTSG_03353 [Salpingoeca rosetta]|uniref:Nucleosome assembly protein n=1 Tax=Salpingoeca rosetta (strain ATCC 50818 / BSB-021) TaxID=946362 RepID=F2U4X6_SALR5|nr:uncharacterized protein PTSG_03353 [Salpingoeca rosetta]EGD82692.1 hypothetical protein PTSG_03353 [Salpingoeca rosetta]|eukprot:XP_004995928.1 hypothetical protein PTSG_03353 [Salpingoeca rosetta]
MSDAPDLSSVTSQILSNPELLAALTGQLNDLVGTTSGLIESLPEPVKRRLLALKKLQREHLKVELEYHAAIARVDEEFAQRFKPLYDKRTQIVSGEYEPKDDELDHAPLVPRAEDDEDDEDEDDDEGEGEEEEEGAKEGGDTASDAATTDGTEKKKPKEGDDTKPEAGADTEAEAKEGDEDEESAGEDIKGVPDFWLTALSNHELISELIQQDDQEVLAHLRDIRYKYLPDNTGFELTFVFGENPFFTNTELTKTYHLDPKPESEDDLVYQGPIFQKAVGTQIKWKEDKDVTVKVVKQKQRKSRGRNAGQVRTVMKKLPRPSFFNFFSPPQVDPNEETPEVIQAATQVLNQDYEIGEIIRDSIIPQAVLWFTGEAMDYEGMDSDMEEEEEEEEEDGGDEDLDMLLHGQGGDDDDDQEEAMGSGGRGAARRKQRHPKRRAAAEDEDEDEDEDEEEDADWKPSGEKPPECKQS